MSQRGSQEACKKDTDIHVIHMFADTKSPVYHSERVGDLKTSVN